MKTIEERAQEYALNHPSGNPYNRTAHMWGYKDGATEQKAIDETQIKLLEEDKNAFIAFCHNIINGMYISVIDAAKEQLGYLENKAKEE